MPFSRRPQRAGLRTLLRLSVQLCAAAVVHVRVGDEHWPVPKVLQAGRRASLPPSPPLSPPPPPPLALGVVKAPPQLSRHAAAAPSGSTHRRTAGPQSPSPEAAMASQPRLSTPPPVVGMRAVGSSRPAPRSQHRQPLGQCRTSMVAAHRGVDRGGIGTACTSVPSGWDADSATDDYSVGNATVFPETRPPSSLVPSPLMLAGRAPSRPGPATPIRQLPAPAGPWR